MGLIQDFKLVRHIIYQICVILAALSFFALIGAVIAGAISYYFWPQSALTDFCLGAIAYSGITFIILGPIVIVRELSREEKEGGGGPWWPWWWS